jgi:hypothetical protein
MHGHRWGTGAEPLYEFRLLSIQTLASISYALPDHIFNEGNAIAVH